MSFNVLHDIWWALIMIGIMILIHELGHYWAARFFDVKVDTFSFGFGPRLFGFKKGETDFRFAAILFGGYVKMAGEQAAGRRKCGRPAQLPEQASLAAADYRVRGPGHEYHSGGRDSYRIVHGPFSEDTDHAVARNRIRGAR